MWWEAACEWEMHPKSHKFCLFRDKSSAIHVFCWSPFNIFFISLKLKLYKGAWGVQGFDDTQGPDAVNLVERRYFLIVLSSLCEKEGDSTRQNRVSGWQSVWMRSAACQGGNQIDQSAPSPHLSKPCRKKGPRHTPTGCEGNASELSLVDYEPISPEGVWHPP